MALISSQLVLQAVGDDNGDGVLEIPDALMRALGWSIEDTVEVGFEPDGRMTLAKINWSAASQESI